MFAEEISVESIFGDVTTYLERKSLEFFFSEIRYGIENMVKINTTYPFERV